MSEKINRPPHQAIPEYNKSDLDNYRPEVVDAMRAQGLTTLKHLQHRVSVMLGDEELRERFNLRKHQAGTVVKFLLKQSSPYSEMPYYLDGSGFKKIPQVIACALETDETSLFGDLDEIRERYLARCYDAYLPTIATAMKKLGMITRVDLIKRVREVLKEPWGQAFFGDVNPHDTNIGEVISLRNEGRPSATFTRGDFSDLAKVVAFALKEEPETLFGAPPEAVKHIALSDAEYDLPASRSAADEAEENELRHILNAAIQVLPENQRRAVEAMLKARPVIEISRETDMSIRSVERHRQHGLLSLVFSSSSAALWSYMDAEPEERSLILEERHRRMLRTEEVEAESDEPEGVEKDVSPT